MSAPTLTRRTGVQAPLLPTAAPARRAAPLPPRTPRPAAETPPVKPAPRRGRHRAPEQAKPATPAVARTQPLTAVQAKKDGLRVRLPFPETAGQLIRHPATGALAISCNATFADAPQADKFPCYAVIQGHKHHGRHPFLTYREAVAQGWVEHTPDIRPEQ